MTASPYNAWKWVSLSPLPDWGLWALGLAVVCGFLLAAWGVRREASWAKRGVLWGLRGMASVALLFFLLQPGIRDLQVAHIKSRLAILVDRSASMGFPVSPNGISRQVAVGRFLKAHADELKKLRERYDLEVDGFDGALSPVTDASLASEPPTGGSTDLLGALHSLGAGGDPGAAGKRLSGVLLFSDGADNTELKDGLGARAKAELTALGAPVSTYLVGKRGVVDLAVEQVKVDDFAFVRNALTAEVTLHAHGLDGKEVSVVLRREGQVVGVQTAHLKGDDVRVTLPFTFTPDHTGRFVYTVSAPVFPGEAVTENNSRAFVLKVIRDRIRILYVVGRPSWDERFLRGLLKRNPNVDLVSFYILRTLSDDPGVLDEQHELSLIPFPMDEIFDTKLHTFDVVIFQNFGYTDPALSISNYERNLEEYVRNGGAFVEIGGDHAFGSGRAHFPILDEALPVKPSGQPPDLSVFRPRLTPAGQRHPITALGDGAAASAKLWASLPPLTGANLVEAKPGATVLLDHPSVDVDGKNAPILAVWNYGRGRAMALMVDESWKWAFTVHQGGADTRLYDRFWANALRWLVRDPALTTLRITADPSEVEPGQHVIADVLARTDDYQPAAGAEIQVQLVSAIDQKVVGTVRAVAGKDGRARVDLGTPRPGAYELLGKAERDGKALGQAKDAVAVRAVGPERADADVRPGILQGIAQATSGKVFALPNASLQAAPVLPPPVVEVGRAKDRPLWDRWYDLVALVGLLGGEWFFRRRFGYV